ncbi:MAG TPA: hypothetical protein VGE37_11185 [Archangium sp.]
MMISLLLALVVGDAGSPEPATRPNLLKSAQLTRSEGCPNVVRLADGVASTDGDVWDNPRAAVFAATGMLEWDLGRVEPIAHLRIQADNNDRYLVSGSLDGTSWMPIWVGQPVELPGVQTRTSPLLSARARYLRLTAEGGDSMYSIAELEAFDSPGALAGAKLERIAPPPPPPPAPAPPFDTGWLIVIGVTGLGFAYVQWARRKLRERKIASEPPPPSA